ncbi:MAG TPA: GNAT family N-acetyltransferase [Actinomycetota bacterium]|nr:GNAT family N-acetyltransferase [Actinomycetota bacterium]
MDIRKLGPGDEELLERAMLQFGQGSPPAPDLFLGDPRSHSFVAIDAEDVVGWCFGYELFRPEGRWMMLLARLDVAEERRRERVGRKLLEHFAEFARAKGHHKMWLFADAGHSAARRLFEDIGDPPGEKLGVWWVFG